MADMRFPASGSTARFPDRFAETDLTTQAAMQEKLAFLVRRVLRGGSGSPALVHWVRQQVVGLEPEEQPVGLADQLANRLGNLLQTAGRRAPAFAGFDGA
jgi:hypothetical protein